MNATMREQVWALKDAGKDVAAIARELGIRPSEVKLNLRVRMTPRRKREAEQFAVFRAAMTRGESLKSAASEAGICQQTGARWAKRLGLSWLYVSESERQDIIARRRDAERAAMLPAVKLEVAK